MNEGPPLKQARMESKADKRKSSSVLVQIVPEPQYSFHSNRKSSSVLVQIEPEPQCPFEDNFTKGSGTQAPSGNSILSEEKIEDFQVIDEIYSDDCDNDDDASESGSGTRASDSKNILSVKSYDYFQLLDEIRDEDHDEDDNSDKAEAHGSEGGYDYDSEVPEEESSALHKEGLSKEMKDPRKRKIEATDREGESLPYEEREKVVLIEKGSNPFEVLPEGWVKVTHSSGMPVYLHKKLRVCTMAKPYFLGQGSVRRHDIPLSAIPCLQYLKAIMEEKQTNEANAETVNKCIKVEGSDKIQQEQMDGGELQCGLENGTSEEESNNTLANDLSLKANEGNAAPPPALVVGKVKIETAAENLQQQDLGIEEVREYCKKRFTLKTIKVKKFKSWTERRKYQKKKSNRSPWYTEAAKLVSAKTQEEDGACTTIDKTQQINPKGKSYVCLLHEYIQHALKKQPKYTFKDLENAASPYYSATVTINDMHYSTGYGLSKKQAKNEAAKITLEILLPELGQMLREESKTKGGDDFSVFDEIRIEDPQVPKLCKKMSELPPYSILLNCLQGNFGLSADKVRTKLVKQENLEPTLLMTVGKHTVQVQCKEKRDGREKASQLILQKLHPHLNNWCSLLRLYGNRPIEKREKTEEQEIAHVNQLNTSKINELKRKAFKLQQYKERLKERGNKEVTNSSVSGVDK